MPRIWASVKRVFFIAISSLIPPRKFYFRIPFLSGGLPSAAADEQYLSSAGASPCASTREDARLRDFFYRFARKLLAALPELAVRGRPGAGETGSRKNREPVKVRFG
jgi:hypothetical protein